VSSIEPNGSGGEVDGGEEISGGFVVAGGDRPELLELAEEILDQMALFVEFAIEFTRRQPVWPGWDYGGFASRRQRVEDAAIGIEGAITLGDVEAAALRDLVGRARSGGLRSSELTLPTVTVTSLGERGAESVIGIIYPPQVALVGFGMIATRPWVADGQVLPRPLVTASLAGDHPPATAISADCC
jgi:hypothetical protein